jgi:hypothetical protein
VVVELEDVMVRRLDAERWVLVHLARLVRPVLQM